MGAHREWHPVEQVGCRFVPVIRGIYWPVQPSSPTPLPIVGRRVGGEGCFHLRQVLDGVEKGAAVRDLEVDVRTGRVAGTAH